MIKQIILEAKRPDKKLCFEPNFKYYEDRVVSSTFEKIAGLKKSMNS